jgi:hypothetical protein
MTVRTRVAVSALALVLAAGLLTAVLLRDPTTPLTPALPAPAASSTASTSASPTAPASPSASRTVATTPYYGSLTPYEAPADAGPGAPPGYRPVFTEHVGRHGSRSLTTDDDGDRAAATWREAADADALTGLGERLGPQLDDLNAAMADVGYGRLSSRGEDEQRELGRRAGTRLAGLFSTARSATEAVQVVTSGRTRAVESAESFVDGLAEAQPRLGIAEPRSDPRLLHFDTTDPDYAAFLRDGSTWRAALDRSRQTVDLAGTAQDLLQRLYTADFVRGLDDPTDEAEALWQLYRIAPAMAGDVDVDLTPFVTPEAASVFGFLEDARYFYSRGPGVTGDDRSYRAAQILLDDFFAAADRRLAGGSTVAVYRFAHAEEIAPLSALLELPGSVALPRRSDVYTWETSAFRTAEVTPLAANISWTLWQADDDEVLVSVEQDEQLTRLGRSCATASGAPGYYRYAELKRCLGGS